MNSDTPRPVPPAGRPWRGLAPGTRVVVRRRLAAAESAAARADRRGGVWTDVIGFVLTVSDDGLRVRTDPRPGRGEPQELWIPAGLITSAKPIPRRPERHG
ncbi:hypothetical protein [Myceligenerans pegani]|uniref:Uncharacterized protein n=1 Tax=Myceligenerans pegani TaxID=2776917 RepID=A0ABR9MWZ5_9MICO|nr:hypothetical protein [Myceligenerans sp. TRM 65318]MBE1875915.1 hypothetical protein [Myceligenerans sp. TRM 65318]MBE3018186.1 hypothetical protein [Myceligenerans sp. TRM 65318]